MTIAVLVLEIAVVAIAVIEIAVMGNTGNRAATLKVIDCAEL
jgi:hypothetical protein